MGNSLSTRKLSIIICALALLALPILAKLVYHGTTVGMSVAEAASVQYIPYTLTLTEVHRKGPDVTSTPVRTARTLVRAQRADGATVELAVMFPGQTSEHQIREITLPDMRIIRAADSVGLKGTGVPASAEIVARNILNRKTRESDCTFDHYGRSAWPAEYRKVGKEMIGDLATVKFVREDPHSEVWHAPALDCAEVWNGPHL